MKHFWFQPLLGFGMGQWSAACRDENQIGPASAKTQRFHAAQSSVVVGFVWVCRVSTSVSNLFAFVGL